MARAENYGIDTDLGDDASRMFYEASKQTFANRPGLVVEDHESFSGYRAMDGAYIAKDVQNLEFNIGFDGIGTKTEISERLDEHFGSAFNWMAMTADDAAVRGAEALAAGNILDVNKLDKNNPRIVEGMRQLALGMIAAAKEANVVVVNGEIAELGHRVQGYGDFNYNWGGGVLWFVHKERKLTGHQISPGDKLVGLVEPGFRSNGFTDLRRVMERHYGPLWHKQVERSLGNVSLGKLLQTPSTIYHALIAELTGGFDIDNEPAAKVTGIAHITGGGQPSKIGRLLEPSGMGVTIDKPIDPPDAMLHAQTLAGYSDEQAYRKWHMGPGMIVATQEPHKVLERASARGIGAKEIGEVTDEPGIRIKNRGAAQQEEWLVF